MTDPFTNNGQLGSNLTLSGREIDLKAETNNSGAITELTWNGFQFINAKTKDRALQTQVSLDNFGQTDFATLNEAGAASQNFADPSSARYVEDFDNPRQLLTKSFLAYDTPLSYDGLTLFCSGNILEKKIDMDFLGDPHIVRATWRIDQYASTKQGAFRWGINLSLNEDLTERYLYDPANDASPQAQTDGDVVSTFLGGPIAANTAGTYAIGLFHAPSQEGNTFTTTFTGPGAAEGGDPKLTTNQSLVLDTEASLGNLGSAAGTRHVTRYICVGTLAEVQAAFDRLEPYVTELMRDPDGPFDPDVVTDVVVQSAPVAIRRNVPFQLAVAAVNGLGARVLNFSDLVTVSRIDGEGSVTGTTTRPFVNGLAEFDDLVLDSAGATTLGFSTTGAVGSYVFVVLNPAPTLNALSPASLPSDSTPGTIVTATGVDFRPGVVARIQGTDVPTTRVSETELRFEVPASFIREGSRTVTAFNPAPGGGVSNGLTFTITDGYAPLISNVSVSLVDADTTAVISWETDERASTEIEVQGPGLGDGYVVVENNTTATSTKNHVVVLENLEADSIYSYYITAEDAQGNRTQPELRTFRTSDTVPPRFEGTGVEVFNLSSGVPELRWATNEPTSATLLIEGNDTVRTETISAQRSSHRYYLTGLLEETDYIVTVTAIDAAFNSASDSVTFTVPPTGAGEDITVVSGPTVTNITDTTATVEWTLSRRAAAQVFVSSDPSGVPIDQTQGTLTGQEFLTHTVTIGGPTVEGRITLAPDTQYYLGVRGDSLSPAGYYESDLVSFSTLAEQTDSGPLGDGDEVVDLQIEVPSGKTAGDQMVVHSVVPVLEQADLALPWALEEGGVEIAVQREEVSYKPEHTQASPAINAVEVIFPVTIPSGLDTGDRFTVTLRASSTVTVGSDLTPTASTGLSMVLDLEGATNHTADILAANNTRTYKLGQHCVERRFYNRLSDGSDSTLGVHTYITEYDPAIDDTLYVRMLITNSHVDPSAYQSDYGVTGKIFFNTLTLDATSVARPIVHRYPDRYCITEVDSRTLRLIDFGPTPYDLVPGTSLYSFRSVSGVQQEVWHAGGQRIEHVALGQDSDTAANTLYQTAVLEYQNIAWPISGRNYGRNARWWGPAYMRSGELPDTYIFSQGGAASDRTGADAYDVARMRQSALNVKHFLRENVSPAAQVSSAAGQGYFNRNNSTADLGCWSPGLQSDAISEKPEMGNIYETQPRGGHTVGWSYAADHILERHHMTMFDANGVYASSLVWRAATGSNDLPFAVYSNSSSGTRGLAPFFTDPAARSLYNQPTYNPGGTCPYDFGAEYEEILQPGDWNASSGAFLTYIIPISTYKFGPSFDGGFDKAVVVEKIDANDVVIEEVPLVSSSQYDYSLNQINVIVSRPFNSEPYRARIRVKPRAEWDALTALPAGGAARLLRCYLGMANTYNAPLYKDLLEYQGQCYLLSEDRHTEGGVNPGSLDSNGTVGQINQDFDNVNLRNKGAMIIDSQTGNVVTPYEWGMDKAWAHFTIAAYHMHTGVDALRTENVQHFESLETAISKIMPGGAQPTYGYFATNRRIAQHRFHSSNILADRRDLAATLYICEGEFVTSPGVNEGEGVRTLPGVEPAIDGEVVVTGPAGEVGIYHEPDSPRFVFDQLVEVYSRTTGQVIRNIRVKSHIDSSSGSPVTEEWADLYTQYRSVDNNMLCQMYYAVGEALRTSSGPVAGTAAGRLFLYTYEMMLAREENETYFRDVVSGSTIYATGFSMGGASGVVDPTSPTGVQILNERYNEPAYPPYTSDTFSAGFGTQSAEYSWSFFPQVCAAYAAQRLGAETLSLNAAPILGGLRLGSFPEAYVNYYDSAGDPSVYSTKIDNMVQFWPFYAGQFAVETWPMAAPWMAEVQHQLARNVAPVVTLRWAATPPMLEGWIRTFTIETEGGLITTEDVLIDLVPSFTTTPHPPALVEGVEVDPDNQSPIQVRLPAGADRVDVTVQVLNDSVFTGDSLLQIVASVDPNTGGPGAAGTDAIASINVEDTEYPPGSQVVSFGESSLAVTEGGAPLTVTLSATNPVRPEAPLEVTLDITGSATEGIDYNLVGVGTNTSTGARTVTFQGGSQATFSIEALQDSSGTENEFVNFEIIGGTDYGVDPTTSFSEVRVFITDTAGLAGGGGDDAREGLLIAKGIQTDDGGSTGYDLPRMWNTTLPMHSPSATLPEAYMIHPDLQGVKVQADVFGITRNQDGEWLHVAVSCPLDHASGAWSLPDDGSINTAPVNPAIIVGLGAADTQHSSANNFYDMFVTRCSLEIKLANVATPYEFILGDQDNGGLGTPEVEYLGLYNRRTTYYGRFSKPTAGPNYLRDEQCLVCKVTVDERTDAPVALVDVSIQNSALSGNSDPYEVDTAADGKVYFDYIKFKTNSTAGAEDIRVTTNAPRVSTGTVTGSSDREFWIVKPMSTYGGTYPDQMTGAGHAEADQQHAMLPGHQMLRRIALYQPVNADVPGGFTADVAKDFARRYDWGWVVGDIGYQSGGWSLENYYIPDWRIFRDQTLPNGGGSGEPGLRGLAIESDAIEAQRLSELIGNSIDGTTYTDFGWAKPSGVKRPDGEGGDYINLLYFEVPFFGGINAELINQERIADRQAMATFDLRTRRPITAKRMAELTDQYHATGLRMPYGHEPDSTWSYIPAWLNTGANLYQATNDNPSPNKDTWDLAPTDLPWNTNDSGRTTFYMEAISGNQGMDWHTHGADWGPIKATHSSRSVSTYGPLYMCNNGGTRSIIEIEGSSRLCMSEVYRPMPYRKTSSLDSVSLKHLDVTENNTLVRPDRPQAGQAVTGRSLNRGFAYASADNVSEQTTRDNDSGSSDVSTRYYAHSFVSVAHHYAVADNATRLSIIDSGNEAPSSANFPHLVGRYMGRKVSPCGSVDLSFANIGTPKAYGTEYANTGWNNPPFGNGTFNSQTVPVWSDVDFSVAIGNGATVELTRGKPPGVVKPDGTTYLATYSDLTYNNTEGLHFGWASGLYTVYGMQLAMVMPRVFSKVSWYNDCWSKMLAFADIYGQGTMVVATPDPSTGKFGTPLNGLSYVDHSVDTATGTAGSGRQGINNLPLTEQQGRAGLLVQWPTSAPAQDDSKWAAFAYNAQAFAVANGSFQFCNIGMKNTRYEGGRSENAPTVISDQVHKDFLEAHYYTGIGTDDFQSRHYLLPVLGFMHATGYGQQPS